MTHAYSESYLNNAKDRLSSFFDYAINDCKLKPDWITALFINTGYAEQFERGNPAYVAGMSGVELARAVITKAYDPRTEESRCRRTAAPRLRRNASHRTVDVWKYSAALQELPGRRQPD